MQDRAALQRRDNRLQVMGVQPWYARAQLSGAAPSVQLRNVLCSPAVVPNDEAVGTDKLSCVQNIALTEPGVARDIPSDNKIAIETVSKSAEPKSTPVLAILDTLNQSSARTLPNELVLHAYSVNGLLVLTDSNDVPVRQQERDLFSNVLFALSSFGQDVVELGEFVWPVFKWPNEIEQWADKDVLPLIQRYITEQGSFKSLLYIGAALSSENLKVISEVAKCEIFQAEVTTLAECLFDARKKAALWSSLFPLREKLVSAL